MDNQGTNRESGGSVISKPKRRWFRFSLRTLFIVLTAVFLWLGWTVSAIRERKQLLAELVKEGRGVIDYDPSNSSLPWHRRALGDTYLMMVDFSPDTPDEMIERVRKTFPEAMLTGKAEKRLVK
jgi:hypothetical protein